MRRRSAGFTLVELLVASTLTLGLIAGLLSAWAVMQHHTQMAADRAALSERALLGLEVIASAADGEAGLTQAILTGASPSTLQRANPCLLPAVGTVQLLRALPGEFPCFPAGSMPADAPLLMIDTLTECAPDCPAPDSPGFLMLDPGCHPVLARSTPELRLVTRQRHPADCSSSTRVALFERRLFYFRDYAWHPGDGLGALMMRRVNPASVLDWGRAEMLVAGVTRWAVAPRWSAAACDRVDGCAASGWASGVSVTLALRGWVRDAAQANGRASLSLTRTLPGSTALGGPMP